VSGNEAADAGKAKLREEGTKQMKAKDSILCLGWHPKEVYHDSESIEHKKMNERMDCGNSLG